MLVTNSGKWDISSEIVSMMEIKPTDGWQEKEGSFDSYDPVVGKWMTNLVATTPIMAKAMKSVYAKLNRQKDLKRSYRRKYKGFASHGDYNHRPSCYIAMTCCSD